MKVLNKIVIVTLFCSMIFLDGFSSCNDINNLPLNVPIVINFSTSGTNTSLSDSKTVRLSDYKDWRDNQNNIDSASFVSAAYWTLSTSSGLKGDINVKLKDQFGSVLFSKTVNNYSASSSIGTPYKLSLSASEIKLIDTYLRTLSDINPDLTFTGEFTISNITGTSPFQLTGKVEIVLEAAVKL
jgi:hypothetical protein